MDEMLSQEGLLLNSEYRSNIVSWIPLEGDQLNILFVGGTPGAIPVQWKERHNISIFEPDPDCRDTLRECIDKDSDIALLDQLSDRDKYDLIIVLGTDKQVAQTVEEEHLLPYWKMLATEGRLVFECLNTMGMRYTSGITKYETSFSQSEVDAYLEELTDTKKVTWFYPYPDAVFTEEVYSDAWMPKEDELTQDSRCYQGRRQYNFRERQGFNEAIKRDALQLVLNNFLVIVEKTGGLSYPAYVKFSNQRRDDFNIYTAIYMDADNRKAVKYATAPESKTHVLRLKDSQRRLENQYKSVGWEINECSIEEDAAVFKFEDGRALENILDQFVEDEKYDQALEYIDDFAARLVKVAESRFVLSDEFTEVFGSFSEGETALLNNQMAQAYSDIDLIFANLLFTKDGRQVLIDYEWSFDFSIPVKFILFRSIWYYMHHLARDDFFGTDLYARYEIGEDLKQIFIRMEDKLQTYLSGGKKSIGQIENEIMPSQITPEEIDALQEEVKKVPLFEQEIYRLRDLVDEQQEVLEALQNENIKLINSASWKVTRPLRSFSEWLRKLKGSKD